MAERAARRTSRDGERAIGAPRLPPAALTFLRALKRNNDREWFRTRKEHYERVIRAPMVQIVERLAVDFRTFAPDHVAAPKVSLLRIYRDTRFSENKAPFKTQVAAVFPCRGLPKHHGAGLYFEVTPGWVWAGGGLYAPDTAQLQAVREHVAVNWQRLRAIVESPGFRKRFGQLDGERLQRVPRGFPKDHAAAEYLKHRQFIAGREFPASFACSPGFYAGLIDVFTSLAPLTRFLNEALLEVHGVHAVHKVHRVDEVL
ncbi:MAG TPA: DUF2461 domain-containing protein [Ktedonobacterales bacterium]|jgi:uncharacterized protein (TIGR02453 family)